MLEATRSVPIVFATVVDPIGAGFIDNLARPGGNATGFLLYEYTLGGKWLELLKQIARSVMRVAVLGMPPRLRAPASLARSKLWRRRSRLKSSRSICATREI
jgi:putative ABC transport system substrate-binding protein